MTTTSDFRTIGDHFDGAERHDDRDTVRGLRDGMFLSIGPKAFVLDKQRWIGWHDLVRDHARWTSATSTSAWLVTLPPRDIEHKQLGRVVAVG